MLRLSFLVAVAVAVLATVVSPAAAADQWADDAASGSELTCTSLSPCTLANAISGANTGDVVRVLPGTYSISATLTVAKAIEVRGEEAADPPVLLGATNLSTAVVSADSGLKLTNLKITAQGTGGSDALTMKGAAQGDRLVLHSNSGDGAKVVSDPATTRLKNSLVTIAGTGSSAGLKLRDVGGGGGFLEVRNVTVYATATGATAIRCETATGPSTIVNSLIRGDVADVDATTAGSQCSAANSNLRTSLSQGLTTTNIVETAPTLDGQYKPLAGSTTIDAGVDNAANGTLDLAGATRVRGVRTDVGAYELQADAPPAPPVPASGDDDETPSGDTTTPTTGPAAPRATGTEVPGTSPLAPASPPELGKSVLLDQAGTGTVLVKLPGTNRFVPLSDAANLPLGTTIDTRKGAVTLSSALPGGKAQTGTFSGGLFQVRQAKSGMTDIHLRGAFTKSCSRKPLARASAKKKKRKKSSVRRLWASDKGGRFRTHGANSVATVRGTKWLTEDRCNGTYTKVLEGAVDVRDKRTGKVKRVKAGWSVLVRRR